MTQMNYLIAVFSKPSSYIVRDVTDPILDAGEAAYLTSTCRHSGEWSVGVLDHPRPHCPRLQGESRL